MCVELDGGVVTKAMSDAERNGIAEVPGHYWFTTQCADGFAPKRSQHTTMLYKFKSKAAGDVIMTQPVGDTVLRALGREPAVKGILASAALGAAISALEAAIAADEGAAGSAASADEDAQATPSGHRVGLRQRAWPMIDMMKRAKAAGEDIVWGV